MQLLQQTSLGLDVLMEIGGSVEVEEMLPLWMEDIVCFRSLL